MSRVRSFAALLSLALIAPAFGQEEPAPTPLRVVREHYDVTVAADGSSVTVADMALNPQTPAAVRNAGRVNIPYQEGRSEVEILEAYSLKPDGTRNVVQPDRILTQVPPAAARGAGLRRRQGEGAAVPRRGRGRPGRLQGAPHAAPAEVRGTVQRAVGVPPFDAVRRRPDRGARAAESGAPRRCPRSGRAAGLESGRPRRPRVALPERDRRTAGAGIRRPARFLPAPRRQHLQGLGRAREGVRLERGAEVRRHRRDPPQGAGDRRRSQDAARQGEGDLRVGDDERALRRRLPRRRRLRAARGGRGAAQPLRRLQGLHRAARRDARSGRHRQHARAAEPRRALHAALRRHRRSGSTTSSSGCRRSGCTWMPPVACCRSARWASPRWTSSCCPRADPGR